MSRLPLLLLAVTLGACGRPDPKVQSEARKVEEPNPKPAQPKADTQRPAWQREATLMPETFAGFPRPDLAALDGVWIVDAEQHRRGVVWIIEDEGSKLTIVDHQGQERIHGITLSSPCALRLTDDKGRAQARAVAQTDDGLIVSGKGAIAVAAKDGSLLACVGHRTYQIAADGRCRYTTEMLGAWSDPIEAQDACKVETVGGVRALKIAGRTLHERSDGVWLDDVAAASVVTQVESREAAIAALSPVDDAAGEAGKAAAGETGEAAAGETSETG